MSVNIIVFAVKNFPVKKLKKYIFTVELIFLKVKVKNFTVKNSSVENFIVWFENQWIKEKFNLYESAYLTILCQDNGFYSANHSIEDSHAIIYCEIR